VSAVAYAGWMAALCAAAGASWLRARLVRHAELVADAGHELRGPLCAARLGLHGLDDLERAAAVDLELRRAALALEDLVAAGSGRRGDSRSELVDVGALLDDGAEAWRPLAVAFGAALVVEPLRGRALVRADPVRLAQACGNVVANAIEHGASPVRVRGRVLAGRVRVEVSDAGPGLPAPVRELAGRRRRGAARGRGLAIAARIAEAHGGRLSAAPSAHGACLVLELPSADAAPWPEPLPFGPDPSRSGPQPPRR
jgi:signal transduction histidine kinase